jgi:hypothetical protein
MKFVPGKGYVFQAPPPPAAKAKEDRRLINSAKQGRLIKDPLDAIARRCIECAYDPQDEGTALDQVARCEARSCPLYAFRPRNEKGQEVQLVEVNKEDSANLQTKDKLLRRCQNAGTARQAINGYCADCIYDAAEPGNWRQQVRSCSSRSCDLYAVRPK